MLTSAVSAGPVVASAVDLEFNTNTRNRSTSAQLADAFDRLEPAEAATDVDHPNLWG